MDVNATNKTNTNNKNSDLADLASIILYFQVVFLSFTIIAALVGNLLVLAATYLDKRLHNANKYFVACLAASDLLVAMFSVTIRLHLYLQKDLPLTIEFCRFYIWVDVFSEAASITSLTVISIDRYYKVSRPFRYKANMSTHKARRIIAFIWVYSATFGALGLFPYEGNEGVYISPSNKCQNKNRTFYTISALFGFFIPVAILMVVCILIFRVVQIHRNKRMDLSNQRDNAARIHQKQTHSNSRGLKTLAMIVVTFVVCWGPFFILFLVVQYNPHVLMSMDKRASLIILNFCFGVLPYTNSFLNPIIYAFFDKTFNVAIKHMLFKRKPRLQSATLPTCGTSLPLWRIAEARETNV